ncbi:MAG: 30S ribosomal protein S1 [Actinomycetota bacterium]|nr:30S ribosomal protein S1 [Actinomycetota bacterium]
MANVEETSDQTEAGYIIDSEGRLVPDYDQTIKVFDDGDVVTGIVVRIDRDEILVDIGYKSEGVIPIRELSIRKDIDPHEAVVIGDEIDALVLQKEDKDGRLILSKKRAEYEKSWIRIEELSRSATIISGRVIEVVKGGLILDIGLRGFLPASLVDVRRVKDLHQFIGQELECKVIEMDRNRNNVVLSRRSVLDDARKQERDKVITGLKKGDVLEGKVSSIVDFGAFVDLGGIDGLIHISELSWTHVDHPSEVLNLGETIDVKVLDIDQDRGRISLGLKQCQDDPWKQKVKDLNVGDKIEGKVTKLVGFGAFVAIGDGVEGLVHISELTEGHVEVPEEAVSIGQVICAKVVDIDSDRRRVSLSIRQAVDGFEPEGEDREEPATTGDASADETTVEEKSEVAETAPETAAITILESGDSASAIEALAASASLDAKTSQAIDEALKLDVPPADDELAEDIQVVVAQSEGDPGSLEDVLKKMKETRGSKD